MHVDKDVHIGIYRRRIRLLLREGGTYRYLTLRCRRHKSYLESVIVMRVNHMAHT